MPKLSRSLLAVVIALALPQCSREPVAVTAGKPLRIGIDLWAGYYPLVLADDLGFLKAANVAVDIVTPQNTDRMLAEFAAHDYDAVCVSFADVIIVTRAVPDLRIVLVSDESSGADQILADQPITSAAGLRGKRIGTNLGGFGELFVRRLLDKHGVSTGEVELVNTDGARVPDLLSRKEIDIGHTWEPYASEARRRGMQAVFTSQETPNLILDGLVFRGDTVAKRPDEVRNLVHAWFRAVEWWRQHPEEGDLRIEKRLKLLPGEARPVGIKVLDAAQNRALMCGTGGEAPLAAGLQDSIDYFAARGLLLQRPDPLTLLFPGTLP
ncbi:MAG: ABC transporter substrate-binding protein [Planctomycetota bacterium]|nr:ABC transporter substrate-binding protein [Planctomycetota bacterium]